MNPSGKESLCTKPGWIKYIEKKCGRSRSAQIKPRHGTYVQKYHQENGCWYTQPEKVKTSKDACRCNIEHGI